MDLRRASRDSRETLKTDSSTSLPDDEEHQGQRGEALPALHEALQASLDGMAGACSRLRGEDVVSVLGFAPSVTALHMQQEIAASLKRSSELANEILTEAEDDWQESASQEQTRAAKAEKRLADKDREILSLREALHAERDARNCAEAKLNELRNTLQSRDEMLHVKNEELSKLHMELHSLAREHCALQLRCRQSEESRHEGVADASSELSFLRRQCKLLQEMNQQLRDQSKTLFATPMQLQVAEDEVPAEPISRDASKESTKDGRIGSHGSPGPLPSISRAAVRAMS